MGFSLVNNIFEDCAREFEPRVPKDAKVQEYSHLVRLCEPVLISMVMTKVLGFKSSQLLGRGSVFFFLSKLVT